MALFKNLPESRPERIVLRAPNWLGDCVMALPAMKQVKGIFPDAEITVAARKPLEALFVDQEWCADVIGLDKKVRASARLQRKYNFDMSILFPNSFASAAEAFLSRIPVRIGYRRDMRSIVLTHPIEAGDMAMEVHQVLYYKHLTDAVREGDQTCGIEGEPPLPEFAVSDETAASVNRILSDAGVEGDFFVFAPGAAYGPAKQWPADHFSELAKMLSDKGKILLVGSGSESEACREVEEKSNGAAVSIAGATSIRELAGLCAKASGYAGNDSGASHVAAASGTRCAVIFGSTKMTHTVPLGRDVATVNIHLDCSPCMERECPLGHTNCLVDIKPTVVYDALLK